MVFVCRNVFVDTTALQFWFGKGGDINLFYKAHQAVCNMFESMAQPCETDSLLFRGSRDQIPLCFIWVEELFFAENLQE